MLLDICKTHRQRYGYLIRQKRIALGMTQKRLIEKTNHAISIRSYIALENGKVLQDMENYDLLFAILHIQYNYECDLDSKLEPLLSKLFHGWNTYDKVLCEACYKKLIQMLTPYQRYSWEAAMITCCQILQRNLNNEIELSAQEYDWLLSFYLAFPNTIQSILATVLYSYQYNFPHDSQKLHHLLKQFPMLAHPDSVRNCITFALHQTNIEHNDLLAWKQLQKFKKLAWKDKNWIALFDIYHWLCLISADINVPEFDTLQLTCEQLLNEHDIPLERRSTYYFNLSIVYHRKKDYKTEERYLQAFLKERKHALLPFLFWYIHNQRLQNNPIDTILVKNYQIDDCSEQLQHLWKFYELLPNAEAKIAQQYLMKTCLPILSTLAVEFQIVFLHELQLLIIKTRNYKDLLLYMKYLKL